MEGRVGAEVHIGPQMLSAEIRAALSEPAYLTNLVSTQKQADVTMIMNANSNLLR